MPPPDSGGTSAVPQPDPGRSESNGTSGMVVDPPPPNELAAMGGSFSFSSAVPRPTASSVLPTIGQRSSTLEHGWRQSAMPRGASGILS